MDNRDHIDQESDSENSRKKIIYPTYHYCQISLSEEESTSLEKCCLSDNMIKAVVEKHCRKSKLDPHYFNHQEILALLCKLKKERKQDERTNFFGNRKRGSLRQGCRLYFNHIVNKDNRTLHFMDYVWMYLFIAGPSTIEEIEGYFVPIFLKMGRKTISENFDILLSYGMEENYEFFEPIEKGDEIHWDVSFFCYQDTLSLNDLIKKKW